MNKTIHFIAGMPQAGTSLLSSILAQNPRFEATKPGGILAAIYLLPKAWQSLDQFQTSPNEAGKVAVMRAMLQGYFAHSDRPVAFEMSRGWLAHLEMAELLLNRKAKVLVPVRDMRELLARFELLWRQSSAFYQHDLERKYYVDFQTVEGRCRVWTGLEQALGLAYSRINDAARRGLADRMHFVPYESLTSRPRETLAGVYDFLGEHPFAHDFNHLQQFVSVNDRGYDLPGAHQIRPSLAPEPSCAAQVLGIAAEKYKGPWVWDLRGNPRIVG
jgi:sulfotransferase